MKYVYGYLPSFAGGSWAVGERTEYGTLKEGTIIQWFDTAEEAEKFCDKLNEGN